MEIRREYQEYHRGHERLNTNRYQPIYWIPRELIRKVRSSNLTTIKISTLFLSCTIAGWEATIPVIGVLRQT